jgi:hypothetical protein
MAALQAGLLLVAMFANAASRNNIRIKILDSETRSVSMGGNGVPKNCDQVNFDAYCNNSKSATMTNTLLVQEGNGTPFRVACTADAKYSRCIPLPKGESYDARMEKHGITVYYEDENGKPRKQLYTMVDSGGKGSPPASVAAAATQPVTPTQPAAAPSAGPTPVVAVGAPQQRSTAAAQGVPEKVKIRCDFISTPPGADITVDWRYVGSTPSEIGLSLGTHVVVISMAGYAEWKRELTVASDSVVNVTATLQKAQP